MLNSRSVWRSDLSEFASDADAVAVDAPKPLSLSAYTKLLLKLPLMGMVGATLKLLLLTPLLILFTRDIVIPERLLASTEQDPPIHYVGTSGLEASAERGWPLVVVNWVGLALLAWVDPVSTGLFVALSSVGILAAFARVWTESRHVGIAVSLAVIVGCLWLMVAGHLDAVFFVGLLVGVSVPMALTGEFDNDDLLSETSALADSEGYEELCLVTDAAELETLSELAPDRGFTVSETRSQHWRVFGESDPEDTGLVEQPDELLEDRGTARLVDLTVLALVLLTWGGGAVVAAGLTGLDLSRAVAGSPVTYRHLVGLSLFLPPLAYYTVTEGLWGQTVGKRTQDLRVVQYDGSDPTVTQAFTRAVAGWVDFLPAAFLFGGALIDGDPYGRRFADRVARTQVRPVGTDGESTSPSGTAGPTDTTDGFLDQRLADGAEEVLKSRADARFIDWAVVVVLMMGWLFAEGVGIVLVEMALGVTLDPGTAVVAGTGLEMGHFFTASLVVPPTVYHAVTEGLWGQTVGKRFRGVRVVDTDGSSIGLETALLRAVVGWVDFLPAAHVLGLFVAISDDYGRRIADLAAGTVVVETDAPRAEATAPEPADSEPATAASDEGPTGCAEPGGAADSESQSAATTADQSAGEPQVSASPADDTTADDASPDDANTGGTTADSEWTAAALDDEE